MLFNIDYLSDNAISYPSYLPIGNQLVVSQIHELITATVFAHSLDSQVQGLLNGVLHIHERV